MSIDTMSKRTRKQLVQTACIAAWADLQIVTEEKELILDLAEKLDLDSADLEDVETWLTSPPPELDPYDIPHAHRSTFLSAFREVVESDGRIDPEESETFQLLTELLG